jgi:hypothetical protein
MAKAEETLEIVPDKCKRRSQKERLFVFPAKLVNPVGACHRPHLVSREEKTKRKNEKCHTLIDSLTRRALSSDVNAK